MKSTSQVSAAGAMSGLEGLLHDLNSQPQGGAEVIEGSNDAIDASLEGKGTVVTPEQVAQTAKPTKGKKTKAPATPKPVKAKTEKKARAPKKAKVDAAPVDGTTDTTPPADETPQTGTENEPTDTAAVEAKPAPLPRVFFGRDKVGRMQHRLGATLGQFLVLSLKDVELDDAELTAKHDETKALIKGMGVKVANRTANLIEFIGGKNRLNGVIERAFRLLSKEGKLVTGDKGNLYLNLIAKPYQPAAARAMGNNTISMLKQLRIIVEHGDKQTFVPNGDSTLLAMVSEKLALSFSDNAAAIAEAEALEAKERADREAAKTTIEAKVEDNQSDLATTETTQTGGSDSEGGETDAGTPPATGDASIDQTATV